MVLAAIAFPIGLGIGAMIGPLDPGQQGGGAIAASAAPAVPAGRPAAPGAPSPLLRAYPAEVLRVIDGDTFEARVRVWPGLDITTRVRLRGIDAPELRARCGEERDKAMAARDALRAILTQGEVGVSRITLDKYGGRVLADAMTHATADIAEALFAAGLVRRYSGGRREGWC
jgi:endonuclease YncB( thermonuclease family)